VRAAFEDEGAQAVVLLINSPGGSPVQAGIINDELRRLKAKHKKPVYAVVEETCASAAYYIAVSADRIFVDKASVVGSIGVLMDGFGFTGLMDKLGVERRLMTAARTRVSWIRSARRPSASACLRRPCWTRSTSSSSTR
jgi:protease-4